jgi:hypothetical protein
MVLSCGIIVWHDRCTYFSPSLLSLSPSRTPRKARLLSLLFDAHTQRFPHHGKVHKTSRTHYYTTTTTAATSTKEHKQQYYCNQYIQTMAKPSSPLLPTESAVDMAMDIDGASVLSKSTMYSYAATARPHNNGERHRGYAMSRSNVSNNCKSRHSSGTLYTTSVY